MQLHNTTLKNSLLVTAIATCATLSAATAAAELNDDAATPQRPAAACAFSVEQTPGQKISRMISETLTREKFSQALSDVEMRSIDINWEALSNPNLPFDHPDIRNSLVRLTRVLKRVLPDKFLNPNFMTLWGQLSIIDASITSIHWDRVKELTPQYFNSISCEVIDLAPKLDGVQFGAKATVRLQNGRTVKYHIKTHSGGLRSGHSSAAKLVNPAELLVYKVLEGLGIGPQSHFFGRDGQNLYIATLDAGVQTNSDGTFTQVPFHEYSYFKDSPKPEVQEQLWGKLSYLPTDVEFSGTQHQQAEALVNAENGIARNFVREVTKLDLIARIMGLTDFQANPDNYGFVLDANGAMKAKAIDFRLQEKKIESFAHERGDFEAFLNGNGCFDYSSTGKAMYYALRKRQPHLRVQEAKTIIIEELQQFEGVVNEAFQQVSGALIQVPMTSDDQASRQADVRQYTGIIQSNFKFFREKLEQWRHVTTSEE